MSLVESVTNVIIGFVLAMAAQIIVFPWFGLRASFGGHLAIGAAFTVVSLARSYALRRTFEALRARCDR